MRLLLDTHVALWVLADDRRLSATARELVEDERHSCYLSAASVWEIAIKSGVGKLRVPARFLEVLREAMMLRGVESLPIYDTHTAAVIGLPLHHRDPFDRLLVAQSMIEGMDIVSKDEILGAYGVRVYW